MPQHLKDTLVRDLAPPAKGSVIHYDGTTKGFGIRVTAGNAKSFVLTYRTKAGRQRRMTIGSYPDWTTAGARDKAKELKRSIDSGIDPLADIEAKRTASTMHQLIDRFELEHLPRKRPGTVVDYKSMLKVHIRPAFNQHAKVDGVSFSDIDSLHRSITKAGHLIRANAVVTVLTKMFSLAIKWNMRTDGVNPAKGVDRNTENQRQRYLKDGELSRLLAALAEHEDQQAANVIRILLLTGARRGEVFGMAWADVDLSQGVWSKPASSVKQNRAHIIPLSAPVRQLLSEIRQQQMKARPVLGAYVFPSHLSKAGHIIDINKAWRAILKHAGITDLHIHDLRHSFASELVSSGHSLPLIGAMLGHSKPATTQRYAHLYDSPLRAAAESVGKAYQVAGNGDQPEAVEPTPIRKGR